MEADDFSPEELESLNQVHLNTSSVAFVKTKANARQTEPFLRGPVPMSWMIESFKTAGGPGLMLGLALWQVKGMNKNPVFPVNIRKLNIPLSLATKRRKLKILENAGLIKRTHEPGKRLKVEILIKKRVSRGPP